MNGTSSLLWRIRNNISSGIERLLKMSVILHGTARHLPDPSRWLSSCSSRHEYSQSNSFAAGNEQRHRINCNRSLGQGVELAKTTSGWLRVIITLKSLLVLSIICSLWVTMISTSSPMRREPSGLNCQSCTIGEAEGGSTLIQRHYALGCYTTCIEEGYSFFNAHMCSFDQFWSTDGFMWVNRLCGTVKLWS